MSNTVVALLAEKLYTKSELKVVHERYVDNKGGNRSLELIESLMLKDTDRFWSRIEIDAYSKDESSRTFPVSRRPSLEDLTFVYYLAFGLDGFGKSEDEIYGDLLDKKKGLQPSWISLELPEERGGDGLGWLVHLKTNVLKEMCKQMDVKYYGIAKDPTALALKIRISGGPNKPALMEACRLSELPVGGNMEELQARLKATTAQTLAFDSQSTVTEASVPKLGEWEWEEDRLHARAYGKACFEDGEAILTSGVVAKGTVTEMNSYKATANESLHPAPAGTLTLSDGDAILTESGSIYILGAPAAVLEDVKDGVYVFKVGNAGGATHDKLNVKFTMPLAGIELDDVSLLWRLNADNKGGRYEAIRVSSEEWRGKQAREGFECSFDGFAPSTRYDVRMRVVHKGIKYETPHDKKTSVQTKPSKKRNRPDEPVGQPQPATPGVPVVSGQVVPAPTTPEPNGGLLSWLGSAVGSTVSSLFGSPSVPAIPVTVVPKKYEDTVVKMKATMIEPAIPEPAKAESKYAPPGPVAMRARLCALNFDLIEAMKARFHDREIDAGEVTKWFKDNPAQLEGTGLSVDDISTDHILPRSVGGHHHVFNYYIMPRSHNSHFRDNWTAEKRAYIGKQGVKMAQGFAGWCRDQVKHDIPFFKFKPDNYLL